MSHFEGEYSVGLFLWHIIDSPLVAFMCAIVIKYCSNEW